MFNTFTKSRNIKNMNGIMDKMPLRKNFNTPKYYIRCVVWGLMLHHPPEPFGHFPDFTAEEGIHLARSTDLLF